MPAGYAVVRTTIAPRLSVRNGVAALEFYKTAFGATEAYRMTSLTASWWRSFPLMARTSGSARSRRVMAISLRHPLGGSTIRIILTIADSDASFARAVAAGASEVYSVGEEYGWRLGRVVDPLAITGRSDGR